MVDVLGSTPEKVVIRLTDGPFRNSVLIVSDIGVEFNRNTKTKNTVLVNKRLVMKVPNKCRVDWTDLMLQNVVNFLINKCNTIDVKSNIGVDLVTSDDPSFIEPFILDLT